MHWAVPWSRGEVINTICLTVAVVIVVAVPLIYGIRANLRDPFARALLAGTSATALAFAATLTAVLVYHAGWNPSIAVWNWVARVTYMFTAIGELLFLIALLRVLRELRNRRRGL